MTYAGASLEPEDPVPPRLSNVDSDLYAGTLIRAIDSASTRVWLKVAWIHPPEGPAGPILEAVRNAAGRGLDVRVLLRPEASNSATLQRLNAWEVPHRCIRYLHEKELLADDLLVSFSANFTGTDLVRNDNNLFRIRDRPAVEAAEAAFHDHWTQPESEAAAGDEQWTRADQVVPEELIALVGRQQLNPLQSKAVPLVFGTEASLVVTAPTGSGKTTVGEAAVLKAIKTNGAKAAFISPSRALTGELRDTFGRWRQAGIRIETLSGDVDADMTAVARADLWVATNESFESAMRRATLADAVAQLGCVVLDEVHLLGDQTRGPLLEALLARLRLLSARTRLVGLSATVANDEQVADWLNAELVRVAWRPTQLNMQVVPFEEDDQWLANEQHKDAVTRPIVKDVVDDGGSVVLFCGSKPKARRLAAALAGIDDSGTESDVAGQALDRGVGIHFRGLPDLKETERRFRSRDIKILVATTGLAQGVNLPARAVIIRDTVLGRDSELTAGQALQMAGRAGRFGQEEIGYAYLLTPQAEIPAWRDRLVDGYTVHSRLADDLADHVLAEILLERIQSADSLREWFAGTFAAHQGGLTEDAAAAILNGALELLLTSRMVAENPDTGLLQCTQIGVLTSRFMIRCTDAAAILAACPGPDPEDADAAEAQILTVLVKKVAAIGSLYLPTAQVDSTLATLPEAYVAPLGAQPKPGPIKALLAAHSALTNQRALFRPGQLHGSSTTELRDIVDDLSRHLLWIGALGMASPLAWLPAVAGDLGYRLKWARLSPPRGSGRLLRLLERRISGDEHRQRIPREFSRGLRDPNRLTELSQPDGDNTLPLVDLALTVEQVDDTLVAGTRTSDEQAYPLHLTLVARSGRVPVLVHVDQWSGEPNNTPYPTGAAENLQVAAEAVAYGRYDWGYVATTQDLDPERIGANTATDVQQRIAALPAEAVVLRRRSLFTSRQRHERRLVEAAINTTSDQLADLAYVLAGHGNDHDRAWRIRDSLNELLDIDTADDGFTTPAAALTARRCSESAWAITYATLARHAGFETGVARSDGRYVALVKRVGEWRIVTVGPNPVGALEPVVPRTSLGSVQVLNAPPPGPPPKPAGPAWEFLTEFRHPAEQGPAPPTGEDFPSEPDPPPSDGARHDHGQHDSNNPSPRRRRPPGSAAPPPGRNPSVDESLPANLVSHTPEGRAAIERSKPGLLDEHPRAYTTWTADEEQFVIAQHRAGRPVAHIAELLGRQPGAIQSRLERRGLL